MGSTTGIRKVALITGANRGLGLATARRVAAQGFHVVLAVRDVRAGEQAAASLRKEVPGASLEVRALDLARLASVRAFADAWKADGLPLHLLINNAGLIASEKLERSADGLEMQFAVNHLGHFLLTTLLEETLVASAPARVVVVSSTMHIPGGGPGKGPIFDFDDLDGSKGDYDKFVAYRNSKLANMWFAYALHRRLASRGVTVNALCPGFVPETAVPTARGMNWFLMRWVYPWMPFARTVERSSEHIAWVATGKELEGVSGRFFADKAERPSSDLSYDQALQERLWEVSLKLTAPYREERSGLLAPGFEVRA